MIRDHDHLIKLILVGSSGVGKTSILTQFADNKFSQTYLTTIGVDFRFKTIKNEGKSIKYQIWDTAGQERFRTITSAYYKGADGIIMVYDVTDTLSLEDIQKFWTPEAFNYCDRNIPVLLLGNKSDCPSKISPSKLQQFLQKYNFDHNIVSAKNDDKIYDSIKDFGLKIIRLRGQKSGLTPTPNTKPQPNPTSSSTPTPNKNIQIGNNNTTNQKQYNLQYKKNCC